MFMVHYAPKVASSQAKIDRNFANYFLELNKKKTLVLKWTYLGLQKRMIEAKSKAKALRHLKFDPILKIFATFHGSLDLCGCDSIKKFISLF